MDTPTATTAPLLRLAYQLVRVMSMFLAYFRPGGTIESCGLGSPVQEVGQMTRTHTGSLVAGGLNWNSLPLRLFAGGNAKFWDPADIDFSRDRADWEQLTDDERHYALQLCAQFVAGEEAVTEDIQPFMAAMRAEGRLGDEMYLTQFAFEEAKHTQVFRMWLDAVGRPEICRVPSNPCRRTGRSSTKNFRIASTHCRGIPHRPPRSGHP